MRIVHVFMAIGMMMIWGCNFTMIHIAVVAIPPFLLCSLRFFLASIPLVFFLKRPAIPFKLLLFYGLIMFALQYSLFFWAMRLGMPAGLSSLLYQINVFFNVFLAALFFKERITYWQIIGIIIAFFGLSIIGRHLNGTITWSGFLLTIAAAVTWAVGSIASKKAGHVNMVALVVWGNLVSWPPLFFITFLLEGPKEIVFIWHHISYASGGAVLYIAYLSTIVCFSGWSWLLHRYPVTIVAPFTLLVPIFGMMSSFLITGESLPLWKISAGILIIGGLMVNVFGPRLTAYKNRMILKREC